MFKCDTCFLLFYNKSNRKAETFSQSNANTWACIITKSCYTLVTSSYSLITGSGFQHLNGRLGNSVNMQCCGLYTSLDQVKCLK